MLKRTTTLLLILLFTVMSINLYAQEDTEEIIEISPVETDIQTVNGVVHVINTVLIPPSLNLNMNENTSDMLVNPEEAGPLDVPSELPQNVPDGSDFDVMANDNFEEILDDTESYLGQEVFFEANLGDNFTEYGAISLVLEQLLDNESILAINTTGSPLVVLDDFEGDVFVIGTLRQFIQADVEEEFDLDLDDDFYIDYEEQTVLLISSIGIETETTEGDMDEIADVDTDMSEIAAEDAGALDIPGNLGETVMDDSRFDIMAENNLDEIFSDTEAHLGQDVFFEASIDEVFNDYNALSLALEEGLDQSNLLAINTSGMDLTTLQDIDSDVFVIGNLQRFNIGSIEDEFEIDLDDDFFTDYEDNLVVIVSAIAREVEAKDMETIDTEHTVTDVVLERDDLSTLRQALEVTGLTDQFMNVDGEYTLFAPTNAAFDEALSQLNMTADELFSNTELLTQILAYHVVQNDTIMADELTQDASFVTFGGEELTVTTE